MKALLLIGLLVLAGCVTVNPLLTRLEKDQIAYNKFLALPLSLENLNAFKEELKQNFHEAIGPSVAYDQALDRTFESIIINLILKDADRVINRLMVEQIAKNLKIKKNTDELSDKKIADYIKRNPKLSKFKEDTIANLKQKIKKLDRQAEALGLISDQDILLAQLRYENKRLQRQRAGIALGALGRGLQNAGRAMQQSEAQSYRDQQSTYNSQMINKQNEILHELRMQNMPTLNERIQQLSPPFKGPFDR